MSSLETLFKKQAAHEIIDEMLNLRGRIIDFDLARKWHDTATGVATTPCLLCTVKPSAGGSLCCEDCAKEDPQ